MKSFFILLVTAGIVCAADFVTGQAARAVIGQETFTAQIPGASSSLLGAASGLAYANGTLLVVDSSRVPADPQNHRVLVFRDIGNQLPGPKDRIDSSKRCSVCGGVADVVLGQSDFSTTSIGLNSTKLRNPTAVATDGRVIAVADTDNNRVLLWNSIPAVNSAPANVVVGQGDFTSGGINFGGGGNTPSAKGLRGPQGVWIQDGRLYVADTQNHRVLIWNSIPTGNGQSADLVLGKPNFTTFVQPDLSQATIDATPSTLLNPVSVTSDGKKLFVADLGHNRVLIWNSIPTQNAAPADIALGQPEVTSTKERNATAANNSKEVCTATGTDAQGTATYPTRCAATLDWPRFALSDGQRLFVADGGASRILVYNSLPTRTGQPADVILGQVNDQLSEDREDLRRSASDSILSPMSLAWDGQNLYASDPYNRRVLVFTPGDRPLPLTGVRNAASVDIFAVGAVTFSAPPKENDEITLTIGAKEYKYKAAKDDDITKVINALVEQINGGAGDELVFAKANLSSFQIVLTARKAGQEGEAVLYSVTLSTGAQLIADAGGGQLRGGQDAAKIAPGTLITILGDNLSDREERISDNATSFPSSLGGVEVYIDGIRAPLSYVSPTQINAQMPWDVNDASSVSAYVRILGTDNVVRTTTAIGVPIIPQNPGIFALSGTDPRPAIALHGSSFATGVISVDGAIKENDVATVSIEDRQYTYTIKKDDQLSTVRDALIAAINDATDEKVTAKPADVYTRIILQARTKDGEGLPYGVAVSADATLLLTAFTPALCCGKEEGTPVTVDSPAVPGEIIIVYATGLGNVQPDEAKFSQFNGGAYEGPELNAPNTPVDDAQAGGKTANVLSAGLKRGRIGIYELRLQLNSDIPTNLETQLFIAQDIYLSNIVTFPVVNPADSAQ